MSMRRIASDVLLPAGIALAVVGFWFWATGDFTPPVLAVVGLALFSVGLSIVAEWVARRVVYALRRRRSGCTARHRRPATSTVEGEA
ncbi:hypothetical protein [Streptomyces cylindrosporus]|uniref:Uncharacterized protein n=1 Tax=Streptomyces cylindrosporus TaxID=2927583 RepID=A0ABS9YPF9_9ACTN|nr:hypothetical protein [Streptomyces cylindrosporus]MCI3279156.1 hypothetical protein [Streptomyces cylindrosporus]